MPKHRHQEWIKFLRLIDAETPPELDLHLIVDNYATHKHPKVKSWLKRHPRFHVHFIPTSSSWLNLIERWFREITDKRIRRGTFRSVEQLIAAIMAFIEGHNADPQSFTWTAKAEDILAKVRRARKVLDKTQYRPIDLSIKRASCQDWIVTSPFWQGGYDDFGRQGSRSVRVLADTGTNPCSEAYHPARQCESRDGTLWPSGGVLPPPSRMVHDLVCDCVGVVLPR
jgi:hypothetical protein